VLARLMPDEPEVLGLLALVGAIEASGALSGYHLLPPRAPTCSAASAATVRQRAATARRSPWPPPRGTALPGPQTGRRREPGLKAPLGRDPGPGPAAPGAAGLAGLAGLAGRRHACVAFPDMLGGDGFDHDRMHNVLLVARITFWFAAEVLRSWTGRGR
jgi:hypothetical protein